MGCQHKACRYCALDIEGFFPYRRGEWRDRGNNSTCPHGVNVGKPHAPYVEPRSKKVVATPPNHLFIDQRGGPVWARTIRELKEKVGPGRVFKIYVDKKDGKTVQCGVGIGRRWFNRYIPWEKEA